MVGRKTCFHRPSTKLPAEYPSHKKWLISQKSFSQEKGPFVLNVKWRIKNGFTRHQHHHLHSRAVRPDWAIFGRSWWRVIFTKVAEIMMTFLGYLRQHNNVRKNLFGYFCEQLLKTIGLLFIPSSDHTAHTNIQLNLDWKLTFCLLVVFSELPSFLFKFT